MLPLVLPGSSRTTLTGFESDPEGLLSLFPPVALQSEVLRAIQHMKRVMPMVGLRFSMMQVVAAAAGPQHPGRFQTFQDEGCTPALDGNFEVLKSLPLETTHFAGHFAHVSRRNKRK